MQTLSIRVPDDVEENVDDLAEANENTRSDQARQLRRAGLDQHENGDTIPTGFLAAMFGMLFIGSIIEWNVYPNLWPLLGLCLFVGGLAWEHSTVRATIRRVAGRVTER